MDTDLKQRALERIAELRATFSPTAGVGMVDGPTVGENHDDHRANISALQAVADGGEVNDTAAWLLGLDHD